MIFKGDEYDDIEGILEGWWSYFTDLFGNSDQCNFDTEKLELAKIQNVIIEDLERVSRSKSSMMTSFLLVHCPVLNLL
jgi:hypothetical protein